jgi:hypothetical protein
MEIDMNGFWIILEGRGGELDREFVRECDSVIESLKELLDGDWCTLDDGDKISIVAGWSEN